MQPQSNREASDVAARADLRQTAKVEPSGPPQLEVLRTLAKTFIEEVNCARDLGNQQDVLLDVSAGNLRCLVFVKDDCAAQAAHLSPREIEIARMVAAGYPNKTVANVLEISPWTVNTHLRRMFAKCGVRSRAALVAKLFSWGLLEA